MKINEKKPQVSTSESTVRPKTAKEAISRINWRLILLLLVNSIVFIGAYRLAIEKICDIAIQQAVVIIYMIAAFVMILIYVIYNRAFTVHGATPDMLPDTMSAKEKTDYIHKMAEREKKSKWMLTVIIPLLLAVTFDLFEIFVISEWIK